MIFGTLILITSEFLYKIRKTFTNNNIDNKWGNEIFQHNFQFITISILHIMLLEHRIEKTNQEILRFIQYYNRL